MIGFRGEGGDRYLPHPLAALRCASSATALSWVMSGVAAFGRASAVCCVFALLGVCNLVLALNTWSRRGLWDSNRDLMPKWLR